MKTAIVIGVGPDRGLGARLCKRFSADGLKVIVAGRTLSALQAVADDITKAGGNAVPVVADATSERDIVALFDAAGAELDLAIYNAGNNTPGKIIEMDADYFENAWRVVCFGGFLFGREAVRRMVPKKTGTLLFTGASASLRGRSGYGALPSPLLLRGPHVELERPGALGLAIEEGEGIDDAIDVDQAVLAAGRIRES